MPKTGRPKHKHGYKRVTFYLPDFVMEHLKEMGRKYGVSASVYLASLVEKDKDYVAINGGKDEHD